MTDVQKKLLRKMGSKEANVKPKAKIQTCEITREDFDLLDVEEDGAVYYIEEDDGSLTIKRGEN